MDTVAVTSVSTPDLMVNRPLPGDRPLARTKPSDVESIWMIVGVSLRRMGDGQPCSTASAMLTVCPTDIVGFEGEADATARHPLGFAPASSGELLMLQAPTALIAAIPQQTSRGLIVRMLRLRERVPMRRSLFRAR